jgi:DNA polymerase-3 subunit gamma/tau
MDKFIVSARKYRPQNFSTVVGQPHITTTLKNAIRNNQLAHAFLFCGPRGVGKTTCARILAKTINCENPGTDGEACNKCQSCISFNDGGSLNIHELDAASNNSVDDIRALVEQVRFAPQAGKYKVYIIDEVHMLTSSAFNAFLKTLEEPPSYAIFILATTEKHKILPTILSRCQIFDFKRITTNDTVHHLEEICEKENIEAERPALQVIAQKSEGCMRDSLSILDKIVSFTNSKLTYQNTLEHLNILDADYYFKLMECMLQQDLAGAMLLYDDINKKGFEGDLVLNGFAEFLRNLLICKDEKVAALLEVVESFKDKYKSMAASVSHAYIISALNVLNESEIHYKAARNKRLHVELALIKLTYLQQALEVAASGNGVTGKKTVEAAKPVAFRGLTITEMKLDHKKAESVSASSTALAPSATVSEEVAKEPVKESVPEQAVAIAVTAPVMEAIEIIENQPATVAEPADIAKLEEAPVIPPLVIPEPQQQPAPASKAVPAVAVNTKLTALNRIRQQYTGNNSSGTEIPVKALTLPELQNAWNNYANKLREIRNPAVQSFELAELRIINDSIFEVVTANNLEQNFIAQERLALTEHLQNCFSNKTLTYQVIVEEKPDRIEKMDIPLSSKEQYQKMIQEYPLVKELKDRLRLDLDY